MSFNWTERLDAALLLVGLPARPVSTEARERAAISSAYYAAYKSAANYVRDNDGVDVPQFDAHRFVIEHFKASPQRKRQKIGALLELLRRWRNQADYADDMTGVGRKARDTFATAAEILKRLDRL